MAQATRAARFIYWFNYYTSTATGLNKVEISKNSVWDN